MVLRAGPATVDRQGLGAVLMMTPTNVTGLARWLTMRCNTPATVWEERGTWVSDGPAVLMHSAEAGSDLGVEYPGGGMPARATVPPPGGCWRVRTTQAWVDGENWVGLVQFLPCES
ncbi:hypothetical protein GCM10010400_11020 [Streptomyces aculeolatus]